MIANCCVRNYAPVPETIPSANNIVIIAYQIHIRAAKFLQKYIFIFIHHKCSTESSNDNTQSTIATTIIMQYSAVWANRNYSSFVPQSVKFILNKSILYCKVKFQRKPKYQQLLCKCLRLSESEVQTTEHFLILSLAIRQIIFVSENLHW